MSLYLCILDRGGEEIDGVEVGPYSYFYAVRSTIEQELGEGAGKAYPNFLSHSDADGEWSPRAARKTACELARIREALRRRRPRSLIEEDWYMMLYVEARPESLAGCMLDVDGEDLLTGIIDLCEQAHRLGLPVLFQ